MFSLNSQRSARPSATFSIPMSFFSVFLFPPLGRQRGKTLKKTGGQGAKTMFQRIHLFREFLNMFN